MPLNKNMDKEMQTGHSQKKKWKALNVQRNLRNASERKWDFLPIGQAKTKVFIHWGINMGKI